MNLRKFLAELKRRKVFNVALAYIVGGWALAQGVAQVLPVFDIPIWVVRTIVVLIVLGFPIALALSWFFDLTRYGIVRTPDLDRSGSNINQPGPRIRGPSSGEEKSIAVLPFTDLSPNRDHDYFSDGIAEEILTALSKIDNLCVAARRSSFWFKDQKADVREIARKLNVGHVLEGAVRRDGNRVRITAELINAENGFTIWSDTFEREMESIFALQDEITSATVDALKLKLNISSPTASSSRNMDAYDAYLQGLFQSDKGTEDALRKSIDYFQTALERDPKFGRAWTGIAKAWLWLADAHVAPTEAYPKVRDAAVNALKINKNDAEAHVYLAEAKRILDWDLCGAEKEFSRAFDLDSNSTPSNYFIAAFHAAIGDREKALEYLQRTSRIDPASLWVNNFACELYRYFGLNDEALAAGERALQLDPTFLYGEPLIAALYREMGRFDDAIALFEKARSISGKGGFGLAITYAKMGRRDDALRTLEAVMSSRSYTPGDAVAHVYVALGDYETAFRELDRARDERSSSLHMVGIAPEFAALRPDKRFMSLLKKIGLEPERVFAASAITGR